MDTYRSAIDDGKRAVKQTHDGWIKAMSMYPRAKAAIGSRLDKWLGHPIDTTLKPAPDELTRGESAAIVAPAEFWSCEPRFPDDHCPRSSSEFPETKVKYQGDRRTCVCFAVLAAMELCFLRRYSLRVVLSEQYANWLFMRPKCWCEDGLRLIDGLRMLSEQGVCSEDLCPYEPLKENMSCDCTEEDVLPCRPDDSAIANARYGIAKYVMIDNLGMHGPSIANTDYLERILSSGYDVVLTFGNGESPRTDSTNKILEPGYGNDGLLNGYDGAHAVLIVGYNRCGPVPYFICKFSSGDDWEHGGYAWRSYEYIRCYAFYGAVVLDVCNTMPSMKFPPVA